MPEPITAELWSKSGDSWMLSYDPQPGMVLLHPSQVGWWNRILDAHGIPREPTIMMEPTIKRSYKDA